jgi:hypothetical protein
MARSLGDHLDSFVEVGAVQDVECDDQLVRLRERAVRDQHSPPCRRTVVASSAGRSRSPRGDAASANLIARALVGLALSKTRRSALGCLRRVPDFVVN